MIHKFEFAPNYFNNQIFELEVEDIQGLEDLKTFEKASIGCISNRLIPQIIGFGNTKVSRQTKA